VDQHRFNIINPIQSKFKIFFILKENQIKFNKVDYIILYIYIYIYIYRLVRSIRHKNMIKREEKNNHHNIFWESRRRNPRFSSFSKRYMQNTRPRRCLLALLQWRIWQLGMNCACYCLVSQQHKVSHSRL